jgi:hypothetical protein
MHDAAGVGGGQGFAELREHVDGARDGKRTVLFEGPTELAAVEKFEHEKHDPVGQVAHVRDLGDVLVADGGRRERLAVKARERRGVVRDGRVEALDRHAAPDERVLALVDDPHPPDAEAAHDAVARFKDTPDPRVGGGGVGGEGEVVHGELNGV